MILLLFLIIGLIVGIFRGGGLSGLDRMRLHAIWLILVSAIAEIAPFVLQAFPSSLYPGILPAIQLARFVPLILFTLLNIKNWRICMAALGLIANFAVISVNHWQMPIGWTANNLPQFAKEIKDISTGLIPGYTVMKDAYAANLWFLADLLPVVRPEIGFASIGDILLGFGVLLTVQHGMARYSIGKHVRGSLARSAGGRTTVSNRKSMPRPQAAAPAADVSQPLAYKAEAPLSPEQNEPVGKTEPIMEAEPERKPEPEAKAQTEANAEPERKIKPKKQAELKNGEKHMPGDKPEPKQKQQKPDKRRKDDKLVAALTGIATEPQLRETSPEPMCPSDFGSTPESESSGNQQIRLSPRLQTVADMAGRMGVAADVGCDHGKLSAWLAINNDMKVIALDISSKSLAKTKLLVK